MARKPGERDYRDLRRVGEKQPRDDERKDANADRRWWNLKGKEIAESVSSNVQKLHDNQASRLRQMAVSTRLYGNAPISGSIVGANARLQQTDTIRDRITYNASKSYADTLVSRIGEIKPRPYFLTSGGNWREQRRAKMLNKYTEGVFYETGTYDKGTEVFRDSLVLGDGFMHAFNRNGRTHHERVMASELWVDEVEAQYGFPRTMYRVKLVDRDELASWVPEKRKVIMGATPSTSSQRYGPNIADMVTVAEAWHLGSENEDGKVVGGKRTIVLVDSQDVLVEPEEWPFDFFPFARLPWCPRPFAYWSQSLMEQLQGSQIELNKELLLIQRSMHIAGVLKVLVKVGTKIVKEQINNDIGSVITWTGDTPPQFYCPEPINQIFFENVNRIIDRMGRLAGVGEMSSSARKPAGLNSGAALREFQDIESDRHRYTQRMYDSFFMQLAAIDVALAGELPAGAQVRVPSKRGFEFVNFSRDVGKVKGSEFVMQCFSVSKLPRDPAGRLQTIQEYIQAGFITQRQGRRALDFPDLDSIESLANAQEDIITKTLDAIVDEGEYAPPEPTDDLEMAMEMVLEYIQRYRALGLEEEKLDLLRTYNEQAQYLMNKAAKMAAAAAPSPPMAPGAANGPMAVPMAPPQSDLIPNTPGAAG